MHLTSPVARGGSPRPIKDYITESPSGINWIKIGDTEKGGKFIFSTKERIKPEGMSKSRFVHKGDFLLTNSMSFGRPYITQVEGCIHDGWLVISLIGGAYCQDFLYYLLSSNFETYLRQGNMAENTVAAYLYAVREYYSRHKELNKRNLLVYKTYLIEKFKPKTVNLRIQAMNKYLDYLGKPTLRKSGKNTAKNLFGKCNQ